MKTYKTSLIVLVALGVAACSASHSDSENGGDANSPEGSESDANAAGGQSAGAAPTITCTPTAVSSSAPIVVAAPSPVGPGETALLYGENFGATPKVFGLRLSDGATGSPPHPGDCVPSTAEALTVAQATTRSVMVTIPTSWTAGTYALIVENSAGKSAPVIFNRARVDWARGGPGGALVAGSTVAIYGRSFGTKPSAYVVDAKGKSTSLGSPSVASDGYTATFAVPSSLAAGSYELYVHNGSGGAYGFSEPLAVSIVAASAWPTKTFVVAAGTGHDDTALADALSEASSNGGGIVEFAKGNFTLTHGVKIPAKTVVRSQSGNRSDVVVTFDESASPFPYGFITDGYATIESITVKSSTSARLFNCPSGQDFLRDPSSGEPQYQPDAPCEDATIHDVSMTLSTLRDLSNGTPTSTIMIVANGNDIEISDSDLTNTGGSALSMAKAMRYLVARNTLVSGSTRVAADTPMPYGNAQTSVGGGDGIFGMRNSAIIGNTIGPTPGLGAGATMFIEGDAHDLYIADNTIGPNLSNYGEGFSIDDPYYPNYLGTTKSRSGRKIAIPRVLNAAGKNVFAGADDGSWSASALVGNTFVVVNGTGLGEYAEVVESDASASDGSTSFTIDRDLPIALDSTSVVELALNKSQVVFARNKFQDVAVGPQLYAGGYDFVMDGNTGASIEGTYCNATDVMSQRSSSTDLQRRFTRCYFNQWINNTMTNEVDASYPWAKNPTGGIDRPYKNGMIGVAVAMNANPLIPSTRGIVSVGNVIRNNDVAGFSFGLNNDANTVASTSYGEDSLIESNQTKSVPIGVYIDSHFSGTFTKGNTCTSGCTSALVDESK